MEKHSFKPKIKDKILKNFHKKKLYDLALKELEKRNIKELNKHIKIEKISNIYIIHIGKIAELNLEIYPHAIFLYNFYVGSLKKSGLQFKGIGRLLLEKAKEIAKDKNKPILLECEKHNVEFYKKFGFKIKKLKAYKIKENVLTMEYTPN